AANRTCTADAASAGICAAVASAQSYRSSATQPDYREGLPSAINSRARASHVARLHDELLEQRAQIERCAKCPIRHCWNGTIMDRVDRPSDDRRGSLTARAPPALPSARAALASLAGRAAAARAAHELPTIPRNPWNPRSITAREVACAVVFDDVQTRVSFMRVKRPADIRRQPITAAACDA